MRTDHPRDWRAVSGLATMCTCLVLQTALPPCSSSKTPIGQGNNKLHQADKVLESDNETRYDAAPDNFTDVITSHNSSSDWTESQYNTYLDDVKETWWAAWDYDIPDHAYIPYYSSGGSGRKTQHSSGGSDRKNDDSSGSGNSGSNPNKSEFATMKKPITIVLPICGLLILAMLVLAFGHKKGQEAATTGTTEALPLTTPRDAPPPAPALPQPYPGQTVQQVVVFIYQEHKPPAPADTAHENKGRKLMLSPGYDMGAIGTAV